MLVCLIEFAEVLVARFERLAIGSRRTIAQPPSEDVGRSLKVNDQIRCRHVLHQEVVQPLVDEELVVVEVQIREDLVLVEQVVADRRLRE